MGYRKYHRGILILLLALILFFSCSKGKEDEAEGRLLPEFRLVNRAGKELKSRSLKKGIYILSVLTSWCNPCKDELEALVELEKKYNPGVNIILATSDSLQWLPDDSLSFTWFFAPPDFFQALNIRAIPTRLLIKDGRELLRIEGVGPLECEIFEDSLTAVLSIPAERK